MRHLRSWKLPLEQRQSPPSSHQSENYTRFNETHKRNNVCRCYYCYGRHFCIECFQFRSLLKYFLLSGWDCFILFFLFWDLDAPWEYCSYTVCFEGDHCDWQTASWKAPKHLWNPNSWSQFCLCLYPESWMQDTGVLSNLRLMGEIEILCRERKRGAFQGLGSYLPLLPAWHIFNKGTGCQRTPLLSICMAGSFSKQSQDLQSFKQ